MNKIIIIALTIAIIITGCAKPEQPQTPAELLSLGQRYLTELNYEQALVQFLRVIEIEPMNAGAYEGAAQAYIALGQSGDAIELLRRGVEATGAPALQALLDELTATPESPPEPNQAPGQSAQQTGEPEWSDLNGMPIFTTEYITNVLGLPLEPMSVYEIPLLYPHHLESFESNRGTMIPGQALGFSGTGGFSHFVNAEGIVIFSGIDMYYDYDFNPPHPLAVSLRNATFADVLGMFRIENPEILTLMKDPIGFLDDNYTYTYDSDNGVRNIHYMTDIYRHREEGRGTFARGYVDVNYLVSPDPEYIHQYITVEYYFDDFKLSFIFSDLDSHNIDLYNIELRYINLYYRN